MCLNGIAIYLCATSTCISTFLQQKEENNEEREGNSMFSI